MDNSLEQLRINRIKMRADSKAFFYINLKQVLKDMAQDNRLYVRTVIDVPENMHHIRPINLGNKNIRAGMQTHYDHKIAVVNQIVIWVKINETFIK